MQRACVLAGPGAPAAAETPCSQGELASTTMLRPVAAGACCGAAGSSGARCELWMALPQLAARGQCIHAAKVSPRARGL